MSIKDSRKIILFGNQFQVKQWKDAFDKFDIKVKYSGLDRGFDIGYSVINGTKQLYFNLEGDLIKNPDGGLWRIGGFIKTAWQFNHYLSILQSVEDIFPLVNNPEAVRKCANRTVMLSDLASSGLQVVPFYTYLNERYLVDSTSDLSFPVVLKIGDYEAGFHKYKIDSKAQLSDFLDSMSVIHEPITIEKFLDYHTEFRTIFVGNDVYLIKRGMDRKGWKVHRSTISEIIDPTDVIVEMTLQAKKTSELDIGALDFVEGDDGYTILELNDSPSLDNIYLGIEDNLKEKAAKILVDKI